MRGVSALGSLLREHPNDDVRVFVIWMSVLDSDEDPPASEWREPLADPRVTEYWDPTRWTSLHAVGRARLMSTARGEPPPDPALVIWDTIMTFPVETSWEAPFPQPDWHGEPVVKSLGPIQTAFVKPSR